MKIQLLSEATATNSPPTAGDETVGYGLSGFTRYSPGQTAALALKSTAGSGTMTVTIKIWLFSPAIGEWIPAGTDATAANRGILNEGNAIDEVAANKLLHTELITGLEHHSRIYAEITAIGGTATAVDLYIHGR